MLYEHDNECVVTISLPMAIWIFKFVWFSITKIEENNSKAKNWLKCFFFYIYSFFPKITIEQFWPPSLLTDQLEDKGPSLSGHMTSISCPYALQVK